MFVSFFTYEGRTITRSRKQLQRQKDWTGFSWLRVAAHLSPFIQMTALSILARRAPCGCEAVALKKHWRESIACSSSGTLCCMQV